MAEFNYDTSVAARNAMEYFGFNCPKGGQFYICETSWTQFVGCCLSNPCAYGSGVCPDGDLRTMSFHNDTYADLPFQQCENDGSSDWYTCKYSNPPFFGCCAQNPCTRSGGCPTKSLIAARLSDSESEQKFFFARPGAEPVSTTGLETIPTSASWDKTGGKADQAGLPNPGVVAGISVVAMLLALVLISIAIWRKRVLRALGNMAFMNRLSSPTRYDSLSIYVPPKSTGRPGEEAQNTSSTAILDAQTVWHHSPQLLHPRDTGWYMAWVWDILLTLAPILFIVLAILTLQIEGETPSSYGQKLVELVRLSPTVYPIIFAAVTSRFYKTYARWSLEQPHGARLSTLEQVLGSQSFAGAFERLLFVRTHIAVGVLILLTWTMSPIGGQSASRILYLGEARAFSNGTVFYVHPNYQMSPFYISRLVNSVKNNVFSLYTATLMSSVEQRHSPRDLWGFPRIPQWPRGMAADETHHINDATFSPGDEDYSSLLGVKIQGLDFAEGSVRYDFSIETSYLDLDCSLAGTHDLLSTSFKQAELEKEISINLNPLLKEKKSSFAINITGPRPPDFHMLYASLETKKNESLINTASEDRFLERFDPVRLFLFNCSMQTVFLETDIWCPSPANCSAWRQHQKTGDITRNRFSDFTQSYLTGIKNGIQLWPKAAGDVDMSAASATENFIAGDQYLYAKQARRDWTGFDVSKFSRHLTTAFNTFWDATRDPLGHSSTNITRRDLPEKNELVVSTLDVHDFFNSTEAVARRNKVYRADRLWIAVLLTTTMFLQILAILGAALRILIKGPDVLGFASSVTRNNIHIPLPAGGSNLDGPDRARMLGHIRVQLGDVRPEDEVGYIAVRSLPADEQPQGTSEAEPGNLGIQSSEQDLGELLAQQPSEAVSEVEVEDDVRPVWRPLDRKRLYL
ncbi:hypothetical protein NM208_g12981 [Fusarium decemcellulare]|uniref:Uncharacterized protein n=1 Tax=Fusarium decemcellulare TaxID=57161 RepID=A0ACC1RMX7_9HYPO|nr:hypothetical protein NM208_g12981 [Fusarium decemcellulare]